MENKYLPLGSVVLLNGGEKTVMIYGRRQISVADGELYDYVSCLFPEGNIGDAYTYLFNHDQIREVLFRGFENEDEALFLKEILSADESENENDA